MGAVAGVSVELAAASEATELDATEPDRGLVDGLRLPAGFDAETDDDDDDGEEETATDDSPWTRCVCSLCC